MATLTRYSKQKRDRLLSLSGKMSVLAIFFDHAPLGFALCFRILAVGFVLPFLHLLGGPKLRFLAGNLVGVGRQHGGSA